jgi:HK97 family phage major capsid protein
MTTTQKVKEVLERADISVGELLSTGGLLQPEQAERFIDEVEEQPTMMGLVRVVRMNSHTYKIDKIGFDQRILKAAPQGTSPFQQDDGSNNRNLPAADRSRVTTRQIELVAKEVMAEIHIPYDVLEDNLERGNFDSHVLTLMARRASQDLEEFMISADTASLDSYLALTDGILKLATTNTVDNLAAGMSPDTFRDAMLAMPQRYLRQVGQMKHFTTVQDEIRYRSLVAQRTTGFGDSALTTGASISAHGVPITPSPFMAANVALFTFPQNIVFGIHRDILIETERDIRARELVIVMSTRVDVQVEDEEALVKIINVN